MDQCNYNTVNLCYTVSRNKVFRDIRCGFARNPDFWWGFEVYNSKRRHLNSPHFFGVLVRRIQSTEERNLLKWLKSPPSVVQVQLLQLHRLHRLHLPSSVRNLHVYRTSTSKENGYETSIRDVLRTRKSLQKSLLDSSRKSLRKLLL